MQKTIREEVEEILILNNQLSPHTRIPVAGLLNYFCTELQTLKDEVEQLKAAADITER